MRYPIPIYELKDEACTPSLKKSIDIHFIEYGPLHFESIEDKERKKHSLHFIHIYRLIY